MLQPEHAVAVARVNSDNLARETRVFDLTVADAHCFYANGILVSNCHDALQYAMVRYFGRTLTERNSTDDEPFMQRPPAAVEGRSTVTGY